MPARRRPDWLHRLALPLALWLGWIVSAPASAEEVVLHLKNGDHISGVITSEDANRLMVSNRWSRELSVPLAEIARREKPAAAVIAITPPTLKTNAAKPEPVKAIASPKPKPSLWKGEAQVGLDLLYGATDRQNYYGRLKLGYEHPYPSDPKKFFRNGFDYRMDYGRTEGVKSSDRMNVSDKIDFDLTHRWYVYNLAGVGYDISRKIDLQYEIGPGAGYHLFARTNFIMNLEAGLDYQAQYRRDTEDIEDFFYRLADDITWKISSRATLTKKVEFFPRVDLAEYRARIETNLAYQLWRNLSWNFTLLDLFDTRPAPGVDRNELQIRSSLGVKF